MDQQRFEQAKQRVFSQQPKAGGIGTLGEKKLHAVLKYYMDPYAGSHEQRVGRYVADIVGENGIVEIQTRGLYRLRDKLTAFLEVSDVTVVHPLIRTRWIIRCDERSGRPLSRRKSPRRQNLCSAFDELSSIKPLLLHPHLHICLPLLDVEEYRTPGGAKHRGRRIDYKDCHPLALVDRLDIACPADYAGLLPTTLPRSFTSLDFAACGEVHLSTAQSALSVLRHVGAVRAAGKAGRYYVYEAVPADELKALPRG